jgi:hypothetical protein
VLAGMPPLLAWGMEAAIAGVVLLPAEYVTEGPLLGA